jgi:hypothetical protein
VCRPLPHNYIDAQACANCGPGTYASPESTSCPVCPAGTYNEVSGVDTCQLCPAGTYNSQVGQSSPSSCLSCEGDYCAAGSVSPSGEPCPAGSYCPDTATVIPCQSGYFSVDPGQTSNSTCLLCETGHYCVAGSVSSEPCPSGSYCPNTRTIIPCDTGHYCPAGSNSSEPCPAGSYCTNAATIITCTAGRYGGLSETVDPCSGDCSALSPEEYCDGTVSSDCPKEPFGT